MTTDPFRALQKALLTHLKAQTSLRVWIGDPPRVYDELPDTLVYPYISLGRVEAQPIGGFGVDATEQVVTLMAVSRFNGTEEARAMAAELRLHLDQANLTLEGQHLVSVRVAYIDVFRGADRHSIYGLVRLRVVSEPL